MDGLLTVQDLLSQMIQGLLFFWNNVLIVPIGDLLNENESWAVQILLSILERNESFKENFLDVSLLTIILFGWILFFVIFTLASWIIDLLP